MQQSVCGFHGAPYRPYRDVGEVELDDPTLILGGLGQREDGQVGGREGGREEGKEREGDGGREGGRERERGGGREGGKEGGKETGGGRKGEKEGREWWEGEGKKGRR